MESTDASFRLKLILGKARVVERTNLIMKLAIGGSTTITVPLHDWSEHADVRVGDLLTLYTEVLYAKPEGPSIQ